jgi:ligand-binding sensor domain-containing protein/AraC-like DNA-binding protein
MRKQATLLRTVLSISFFLQAALMFSLQGSPAYQAGGFFQHNAWTNDDGLPMNTVIAMAQTPDGYLWLGTEAGIARFDGMKFAVFNHENTPAFSNSIIVCLMVDRGGTLWIATRAGGLLRCKNSTFTAIKDNNGLIGSETWSIIQAADNAAWIGSGSGLFRMANGNISRVALPASLANHTAVKLLEDRDGRIWVGTRRDGLARVSKRGSRFESQRAGLAGMEITALFQDRKGALWAGTMGNGLFKYWNGERFSYTVKNGLGCNSIGALHEDRFGNLWIGTQGGGIDILTANGKIHPFRGQEEYASPIVHCFFEDREGTLWIGTGGSGLHNLREARIAAYTTKNGLSFNNAYGVFQDGSGRVWVGTKGYGVNYFKNNCFHTLTTRDGLSSDSIVTMTEDPAGSLWFASLGSGINRYRDGRVEIFTLPGGLASNTFRAIYTDPAGNVLAGSINGRIFRLGKNGFSLAADVKARVNAFLRDSSGTLWAGTFGGGLCRVNLENGHRDVFNTQAGLSDNIITCIHEDEADSGTLWIGTARGLNRFRGGTFKALFKKDGLPDDTVYWILQDHKQDIWVSSNQGIYCLNRGEALSFLQGKTGSVQPILFGKEAGMRSVECNGGNQPGGWKCRGGKLWFPTTHGVCVIDPKNIGMNNTPPPVVVEKIIASGVPYPHAKRVIIPPGHHIIEIHYTAPSFIVPADIRFKYRMKGFDKDWIDAGNNRKAYYSGLPPGEYRFHVTARGSDGVWNTAGITVGLYFQPAFYQTLAFKISVILAIIFFILASYRLKKQGGLRQALRLKRKSKDRTAAAAQREIDENVRKLLYLLEVENVYKDANLSIKSLASKLIVAPRTLSHLINDQLETNFHNFITGYRIKEARRLLSAPGAREKSILEIAHEVGYNSKSAFNRAFKEITQMTPSEFRKKERKANGN